MSVAGIMKFVLSSTEDVAQIVDSPQMEDHPQLKGVIVSSVSWQTNECFNM